MIEEICPDNFILYLNIVKTKVNYHGYLQKPNGQRFKLGAYSAFQLGDVTISSIRMPLMILFWQDLRHEVFMLYVASFCSFWFHVFMVPFIHRISLERLSGSMMR